MADPAAPEERRELPGGQDSPSAPPAWPFGALLLGFALGVVLTGALAVLCVQQVASEGLTSAPEQSAELTSATSEEADSGASGPLLELDADAIDVGTVPHGEVVEHVLTVTNCGEEVLVIEGVEAS